MYKIVHIICTKLYLPEKGNGKIGITPGTSEYGWEEDAGEL